MPNSDGQRKLDQPPRLLIQRTGFMAGPAQFFECIPNRWMSLLEISDRSRQLLLHLTSFEGGSQDILEGLPWQLGRISSSAQADQPLMRTAFLPTGYTRTDCQARSQGGSPSPARPSLASPRLTFC